jgi:hypothetical protein
LGPKGPKRLQHSTGKTSRPGCGSITIGGYQVVKKWLSYREQELLGRPLRSEEAREVTAMTRRLAAIILLQPGLDANYKAVKGHAYAWPAPAPQP